MNACLTALCQLQVISARMRLKDNVVWSFAVVSTQYEPRTELTDDTERLSVIFVVIIIIILMMAASECVWQLQQLLERNATASESSLVFFLPDFHAVAPINNHLSVVSLF